MTFWEYDNNKPREEGGMSKLSTNTLQELLIIELLIITDMINIMKLALGCVFEGVFSNK